MPPADALRICLIGWGLGVSPLAGGEPPAEIVERLTSELYPQRETAAGELFEWASDNPDDAKEWLTERALGAEDPELQQRSVEILRQLVLSELRRSRPGFVGINMGPVPLEEEGTFGVRILEVVAGSPAEQAGLKAGEIIVALEGCGWSDETAQDRFAGEIGKMRGGETVTLSVIDPASEDRRDVRVTLAPRPWKNGLYPDRDELRSLSPSPFRTEAEAENEVFRDWFDRFRRAGKAEDG